MATASSAMLAADCGAVAVGAVAGALLRYGASKLQVKYQVSPWGIAGVNVAGSFVLGAVTASTGLSPAAKLLLGTGFCGSFTTFSTYSVDTLTLLTTGKAPQALAYVCLNNVGGVLAAAAGFYLTRGRLASAPSASSAITAAGVVAGSSRPGALAKAGPAAAPGSRPAAEAAKTGPAAGGKQEAGG